jgi:toluene monooxygenase system ferredoxin subunit
MNSSAVFWVEVASLDQLWEGDLLEVTAERDSVLLVHLPGGVFRAYQARCPHQGYPLTLGELEGEVLTCSAHHWQFDLVTGDGLNPSNCRLYNYPIHHEDNRISVGIPQDGQPHYHRCRGRVTPAWTRS